MEENKPIHNPEDAKPPNNEEQLNTPSTIEPIVSAAETSEIINHPSEIKDMEVHHHAHESHHKKNWKSYFWEFLMLFLAVFSGFLAEYQLEHVIENQREKQYMQSFVYDLQNDTSNLNAGFPLKDERIRAIDSVFQFFELYPNINSIPGNVFRQIRRTVWDRHYRRNTTTIDQLKNAGGLRLIRKQSIRDAIAAYDLKWLRAEFSREMYITYQNKEKDLISRLVNAKDLVFQYRVKIKTFNNSDLSDTSIRVSIYPEYLNAFLNTLADQKISTGQDKRAYLEIEQSAERLITLIKKEYHFK
jgi:hypothetical protein